MENRKLIILFSLFLSLTISGQAFAYEVGTHAFLTKEILSFYNKHFPDNLIPEELGKAVIGGSIREDDSVRWMNHFYDPVYNRGLTLPGNWLSSKEWARNDVYQTSITYNPIMRTTIADFLAVTNPEALRTTDYTWERAIKDYLKGDKKRAFRGLGQVLHLIEDASVPDHTRNDPHPALNHDDALETGSPYEIWTSNFNLENPDQNLSLRLLNKKPINSDGLNAYFDGIATYSNNNFYSKDTIGIGEYKSPEPDYFSLGPNGKTYGFKRDPEFGDFYLVRANGLLTWNIDIDDEGLLKSKYILNDYWSRLSVKAVQYGAGTIDLFFKEVEKAKNDPNFVKTESKSFFAEIKETTQSVVSDIISTVEDFVGAEKKPAKNLAATVYLDKKSNNDALLPTVKVLRSQQSVAQNTNTINDSDIQDEDLAEANIKKSVAADVVKVAYQPASISTSASGNGAMVSAPILSAQPSSNLKQCSFKTNQSASRKDLLINEVAWMGGLISANDEWFELKNISGKELNLANWQILDKNEQIKIAFSKNTKLPIGGLMFLERTDDNSVPGLAADLVYAGALSNNDEELRLFDNDCNLIDEVLATSTWPAGISDSRKTMERQSDLSWATYSGSGENFGGAIIMGTPKKENSQLSSVTNGEQNNSQPEKLNAPSLPSVSSQVVISEIQITGGAGQTVNDFIELYNPTDLPFNLNGHRLVKRTKTGTSDVSIKSWIQDVFIPAKGFYLWANSGYIGIAVIPDATTTAAIADDNGIALRQGSEDTGVIIDSVAWGEAQNIFAEEARFSSNPGANQSLERKAFQNNICFSADNSGEFLGNDCDTNNNQNDFALRALSKPQNSRSFPEPRDAPTAVSNFNVNYSSSTLELILNWNESRDYFGATSTISYLLKNATSSEIGLKDFAILSATTSYRFRTQEVGLKENFDIIAQDREGAVSESASATIIIPSIFSEVYFYSDLRYSTTTPTAFSLGPAALELRFDSYPFTVNPFVSKDDWRLVLFYKNQEALIIPELTSDPIYGEWGNTMPGAWKLLYADCVGSVTSYAVLILPDGEPQCVPGIGIRNSTLSWSRLEDKNLIISLALDQAQPQNGDYLTVVYYGVGDYNGTEKLVAVDRQKYFFQNAAPTHKAPVFTGPLSVAFDKQKSEMEVSWPKATDKDSLDNYLSYEINYSTTTDFSDLDWQASSYSAFKDKKIVSPGSRFLIGVRAKDDFGIVSAVATTTWFWPEIDWIIKQEKIDGWSRGFGTKNANCGSCSDSASLQRIAPLEDMKFDTLVLKLRQSQGSDAANLRLRVYSNESFPNFENNGLGEAVIKDMSRPDENSEVAFVFDRSISLLARENYWLLLDVEKYSDDRGFYRDEWQNAIHIDGDFYGNGEAGVGTPGSCGDYCHLYIPYPNGNADWYFKIGLSLP